MSNTNTAADSIGRPTCSHNCAHCSGCCYNAKNAPTLLSSVPYVGNVATLMDNARKEVAAAPAAVSFSMKNDKMGPVPSVSLLAVYTCPAGVPCAGAGGCYAEKSERNTTVKEAHALNTAIWEKDPDGYFFQVSAFIRGCRFFRWHVAGDIPNADYFRRVVDTAAGAPWCEMVLFTKRYWVVNAFIDNGGKIPANLHIIFSNWGSEWVCDNPHNIPVTDVIPAGAECPSDGHLCPGRCFDCAVTGSGCFALQAGEKLYFHKH